MRRRGRLLLNCRHSPCGLETRDTRSRRRSAWPSWAGTTVTSSRACRTQPGRRGGSAPARWRCSPGVEITNTLEARGEHEAAIEAGREALGRAGQLGLSRYAMAPIAGNLAESLTSAARWNDALEVIEEGLSLDPAPYSRVIPAGMPRADRGRQGRPKTAARTSRSFIAARQRNPTHKPSPWPGSTSRSRSPEATSTAPWRRPASSRHAGPKRPALPVAAARRGNAACADAAVTGLAEEPAISPPSGRIWASGGEHRPAGPGRARHAAVFTAEAARAAATWTWRPGMPLPRRGTPSGSPTRWPARCCEPRAPRRRRRPGRGCGPAAAGGRTGGPAGCPAAAQEITRLARRARIDLPHTAARPGRPRRSG